MTRLSSLLFTILLGTIVFFFPSPACAQEIEGLSSEAEYGPRREEICPVVCSPHEACIQQRCVETCRTGCRPGTMCTASGECEALPEPKGVILTEADRQRLAGAASAHSRAMIFADLGGVLGFGMSLGLEFGRKDSFIGRLRALNTGLMSHAVFAENEFQRFEWGFGGSAAYRHYEATWGNLRGFYYGGGLDYSAIRVADRVRSGVSEMNHSVAPFGEFGYRWVFGTMALGFGPTIGLRYPIGSAFSEAKETSCSAESRCDDANGRRFEGVLHVELGWFQ